MIELQAIVGILGLTALACFIYGPWQAYCVDKARQALFAKREELFHLACVGSISFDSKVYVMVRKHIEGLIRFAHYLTWARFILLLPFVRRLNLGKAPNAPMEIAKIDDEETKRLVQGIYDRSGFIMLEMVVHKSPILFIVITMAKTIFYGAKTCANLLGRGSFRLHRITMRFVEIIQQTQVIIRVEADSTPY